MACFNSARRFPESSVCGRSTTREIWGFPSFTGTDPSKKQKSVDVSHLSVLGPNYDTSLWFEFTDNKTHTL